MSGASFTGAVKEIVRRYGQVDAGLLAAAIAYHAVFALFPIALAVIAILGFVMRDPAVLAAVQGAIVRPLPPELGAEVEAVLVGTSQAAGVIGLVGLAGLLWAGSTLFGVLQKVFNRVYEVADRSFARQRLLGFAMIFVFTALVLVSVLGSSLAQAVALLADDWLQWLAPGLVNLAAVASLVVSAAASFLLFLVLYRIVPNAALTVGHVWPGTLAGGLLFVLLVQVFPIYLRLVADFDRFGALFGFLFLVLTWFFFVGQVIILGAVINRVVRPPGGVAA